jgi:diguanylate cyclase (GGDEF)-like protein
MSTATTGGVRRSQLASFPRRFVYSCAGGLLSAGAPAGLLGMRLALRGRRSDRTSLRGAVRELVTADSVGYIYVGASTAVVFGLFGYILGRQADRLAVLSETDVLTGLTNARGFFDRLDRELARSRRYREPLALLLVDLDGLKDINDRYGHRAGDEAIRSLADVIRSQLRETDVGARWGGDEFAILAPRTSEFAALALAERIRALIPGHSADWPLSGSVGVTAIDPRTDGQLVDSATLMRAADVAMYQAKRGGKNRVAAASADGGAAREIGPTGAGRTAQSDAVSLERD